MEPTNTVRQDGANLQLLGISSSMMGLVATAMTAIAIVGHWRTYGWGNKSLAIFLVVNLVIVPFCLMFKEKTWAKRLEAMGKADLVLSYSWALLATILFNPFL